MPDDNFDNLLIFLNECIKKFVDLANENNIPLHENEILLINSVDKY